MQKNLLFLFVIFIGAYPSKSTAFLQCSSLLEFSNGTANESSNGTVEILEVLGDLESKIVNLYGEQLPSRTTLILLQNLHQVIIGFIDRALNDEALSSEENNFIHTISKSDLSNLNENEKAFELLNINQVNINQVNVNQVNVNQVNVNQANINQQEINTFNTLEEMTGFENISPSKHYKTYTDGPESFTVSFTRDVLDQILNKKTSEHFRKYWWRALSKGISRGNTKNGIKIMKTSDGVVFAQIKSVGLSGSKRVYGVVVNNHITFLFIDKDTFSPTDPIHGRIKQLYYSISFRS